jgi:late competence protein required for DNA uptake (superfamily II DNA/RNA helicase)
MKNKVKFPVYESHSHVKCFRCGRPISGKHYVSEYPTGKYYKDCRRCTSGYLRTYYDIDDKGPPWL